MTQEAIDISKLIDDASNMIFNGHRKESFKKAKWCYDNDKDAVCTGDKLADAGFYFTGTRADPSAATCAFCLKEMIFDDTDDPWQEHVDHCPDCYFVQFDNQDETSLTMTQLLQLIAFRKSNLMAKWFETQMKQFSDAAEYVKKMKPK